MSCATLARSRAFIRVSLERREHHGPYAVTVVVPFPSQSLIRSGFFGPAVFWVKDPARTPCSGSFSKGRRAKPHVRVRPRSVKLAGSSEAKHQNSNSYTNYKRLRTSEVCYYTLFLEELEVSSSQLRVGERSPPSPQLGVPTPGDEAIKGDVRLRTLWLGSQGCEAVEEALTKIPPG
jgi:hypothetical protein